MATIAYRPQEALRFAGMRMLEQGLGVIEVARSLNVAHSTVSGWKRRLHDGGMASVQDRPRSGRPRKLSDEQRRQLREILIAGPLAAGYRNDLWTLARVATVIQRRFGVRFHPNYVGRLMHELGFTHQKPVPRARRRDEEAIQNFRDRQWKEIKKKGQKPMLSYY